MSALHNPGPGTSKTLSLHFLLLLIFRLTNINDFDDSVEENGIRQCHSMIPTKIKVTISSSIDDIAVFQTMASLWRNIVFDNC